MLVLHFRVDGKHFENGGFSKSCHHDNHVISLPKSKMTSGWCIFKFLRISVEEKHLKRF